ncbi:Lcl C-terminal domain-containing protein [Desulfonatronum thiodismutans]|uniref:Lcl C-terminal domain-containing protein n=1 Tax=Desulfonatronum thiodismutans TaxID=159290 RepID=UPI001378404E|nr:DUF1566 domain-containing protein [Desulfonatronum thiodismutans]
MSRCGAYSISGIGGWKLPSKDELQALHRAMRGGHPFAGDHSRLYWSSEAASDYRAWSVHMSDGSMGEYLRFYNFLAWPVRNVQ